MSAGILDTVLFYPGHIALDLHKPFCLEVGGRLFVIGIFQFLKPLEILDFDNGIESSQDGERLNLRLKSPITEIGPKHHALYLTGPDSPSLVIESARHLYRLFKPRIFTELCISHEIDHPENPTDEEVKLHQAALETFVSAYRYVTRDVRIRLPSDLRRDHPLVRQASVPYSDEDLALSVKQRLTKNRDISPGLRQFDFSEVQAYKMHVDHNPLAATEQLKDFLALNSVVAPEQEMLIKAQEELNEHKNFKYALLEAFLAIELVLSRSLTELKRKMGVSAKKLKEFETEIGISYMINVEAPILLGPITTTERQLLGEVDRIRGLRNHVVHRGHNVSAPDAKDAVNAAIRLIAMINDKLAAKQSADPA